MASQCVKDLRKVSDDIAKAGFPVSAQVCHHAADRMERMEQLIVKDGHEGATLKGLLFEALGMNHLGQPMPQELVDQINSFKDSTSNA